MINKKGDNQFDPENQQLQLYADHTVADIVDPQNIPINQEEISDKPRLHKLLNNYRFGKNLFYFVETPEQIYVTTLEQVLTIELLPAQELITQHKFFIDMMNTQNDKIRISRQELNQQLVQDESARLLKENLNEIHNLKLENEKLNDTINNFQMKNQALYVKTPEEILEEQIENLTKKLIQLENENQSLQQAASMNQQIQEQNKQLNEFVLQLKEDTEANKTQFQMFCKIQEQNKNLDEIINQLRGEVSSLQNERVQETKQANDEINVLKLFLADKEKTTDDLEKISAGKDKKLIELQIILQNRITKVVELEEKIDYMKDDQIKLEKLFHLPNDQNFYKDLLVQKVKFDQLSQMYQIAISGQQQIISQSQVNQKKIEQKNIRINKLELQNLDLRRQFQNSQGQQFKEENIDQESGSNSSPDTQQFQSSQKPPEENLKGLEQ